MVTCTLCDSYYASVKERKGSSRERIAGILQGCCQIYEHFISKGHCSALNWWSSNKASGLKDLKKSVNKVTKFVSVKPKKQSHCLFLWDPDIVSEYKNDKLIRRVQPKTIFKNEELWSHCWTEENHQKCTDYDIWKKNHDNKFRQLCTECNTYGRSVYVPGSATVLIGKKSVFIEGGIKSLDPPCLGIASTSEEDPHPYTCDNCWKTRHDLNDLMEKRKASRLKKESGSRIGVSGFRHDYANKQEIEISLNETVKENKLLIKEKKALKRIILDKNSWVDTLHEACITSNDEKLVIDFLGLLNQKQSLQFQVLRNLIGKMKSGNNHKFSAIIKDISSMHLNRLGRTNYSLLEDLLGWCGKTTAAANSKGTRLQLGLNGSVILKAIERYQNSPIIECSDETRALRFVSPIKNSNGDVELVGECWDSNINNWDQCLRYIPRKDEIFSDDFDALKNYIDKLVENDLLAKSVAIHNFAALTGLASIPLIYIVWPTPNKGYKSVDLLRIWDTIRYNCFYDENKLKRPIPLKLLGHATDSAAFQLAAAKTLMSPDQKMLDKNILYLTLGIGESRYAAPYLGYLPSIAYLDYDHEMRLLLKCLKYPTLELTFYPGENSVFASVNHLKELQTICLKEGTELPFSQSDLLFARFLDQNCDAALKIMNNDTANLLDSYVPSSKGTVLYIRAVVCLMTPFLKPSSDPNEMQKKSSKGITIFRLWRKVLQLKALKIHAGKGASENPHKRGKFITSGCYDTAEVLFAAAVCHMLAMYAHFKTLGPEFSAPYKSGTKTTERIISELQGKTTEIQSLDAQPTVGDVLSKVSNVQFNQLTEDNLIKRGAKKQSSTNRRRMSHALKFTQSTSYEYPLHYKDFLDEQRNAYNEGVKEGKVLFETYCQAGAQFLKDKGFWSFLEEQKPDIPLQNQFMGDLPEGYAEKKLTSVKVSDILHQESRSLEHELLKDSFLIDSYHPSQCENTVPEDLSNEEDKEEQKEKNVKWYVTKRNGTKKEMIHISRAIKILLPREYVSRERSRRHIASNFLPGREPIDSSHDLQKYRFYIFKAGVGHCIGKVIFLERNGNSILSCVSTEPGIKFRAILFEEIDDCYVCSSPIRITTWLVSTRIFSEIHLEKDSSDGLYKLSEKSRSVVKRASTEKQIENDRAFAKEIESTNTPMEYLQVEEILNQKVDAKTHSFMYLVKFKDNDEQVWIPACNFAYPVKYQRRKGNVGTETQYACMDTAGETANENYEKVNRKRKNASLQKEVKLKVSKKSINKLQVFKRSTNSSEFISENLEWLGLRTEDVDEIRNGEWLADRHIHAASLLFQKKFPEIHQPLNTN